MPCSYPPLARLGLSFASMAQPRWFAEKPRMAWAFYGHRQQLYRRCVPHAGHELLRRWAERPPAGAFVATSNVDGQFAAAGFPAASIAEVHGNIFRLQCTAGCSDELWAAPEDDLDIDLDTLSANGELPTCQRCGAIARPNILMFDDDGWVSDATHAQLRRFEAWLAGVRGRRTVVLEIGAGDAIPTIRALSERLAERANTTLVRVNPDASDTGEEVRLVIPLPALQALTHIDAAFR